MLTSDLVDARERDGELVLVKETPERRGELLRLCGAYLDVARAGIGEPRSAIEEAWDAVPFQAKWRRLALGARKLVEDVCDFETVTATDPVEIRRAVFERAAAARLDAGGGFDRSRVLDETAQALETTAAEIERGLFADLRDREILREVTPVSAEAMAAGWELAQVEAVLLRAVDLDVEVRERSPAAYRSLLRTLRFRGLLFRVERADGEGYRLRIDGPFSLFESVTKYGLGLALAVRDIAAAEAWKIEARIRWGKERRPLVFRARGEGRGARGERTIESAVARRLAGEIKAMKGAWKARGADALFDVPGVGVVVPDLELVRGKGERVWVELLGFWSRDAVWKRVEMVERGLGAPIVFVASKKLRVKEEVMPDEAPGSLYVYATEPSAKRLVERAEALLLRAPPAMRTPRRRAAPP